MTPTTGGRSAPAQRAAQRGLTFGLSGVDADDYYDVVMSSEDEDDASDVDAETERNTLLNAAQPRDEAEQLAALSLDDTAATPSAVMKHIGSMSYSDNDDGDHTTKKLSGKVDEEYVLTDQERVTHTQRRSALETALDTATLSIQSGEAPFRYASARGQPVTSPAPSTLATPTPSHAPQQSVSAKRKPGAPLGGVQELDSDDEELNTEPDPLYDDAMDDDDEKWVQSNLRDGGTVIKTDATLCCPCCFVTVCMDCQRHVKYHNQYRARSAMNCRVKKDEILTYALSQSQPNSMMRRSASSAAAMLGKDEYFGVVCSDCGTTVGVFDAQQSYHFFNILPSNC